MTKQICPWHLSGCPTPNPLAIARHTTQMLVAYEREAQDFKWGDQSSHPDTLWLAILVEEVGELAKAILENKQDEISDELVQCAAVAHAWIEARVRNGVAHAPKE